MDAHHFDPADTDISHLRAYDRVFNVLHGTFGEDGSLQGVLDGFNLPYTGCGVLASAIAMDKFRCRLLWQSLGLPNVPYVVLHDDSDFSAVEREFGLPLFVKPAAEGSSVVCLWLSKQVIWQNLSQIKAIPWRDFGRKSDDGRRICHTTAW